MGTLGQDLKRERELRGISLKEIADTTKINSRFLKALEEDQIDFLPSGFFIRGIIRAYTDHLGLDTEDYLNQFMDEERLRREMEDDPPSKTRKENPNSGRKRSFLVFCLIVVVLASVLTAAFLVFRDRNHPVLEEQILRTSLPENPSSVPAELEEEIKAAESGMVINLNFLENTWIQIISDGILVLDGNQSPGFVFRAAAENELVIHCGNLGGFAYTLNGRTGKRLGRSGDVKRDILITPDTLDLFLEETPDRKPPPE